MDTWYIVDYYIEPLKHIFKETGVTEISINKHDSIFVKKNGIWEKRSETLPDENYVKTMITQIANALQQVVNEDNPILDARLADGTRVCAVLFPIAVNGSTITFRIFPEKEITAKDLITNNSITKEALSYLKNAVKARKNNIISGGTDSGKTTLLNVFSTYIDESDRILPVEDTTELKINIENTVSFEAPRRREKKESLKVDMAQLIKTCLRFSPTRILVGEIRDSEAANAFINAINTGHSGCMTTVHANSCEDALNRIQILVAGSGALPYEVVKHHVRNNIHTLVHAETINGIGRRIVEISKIVNLKTKQIFKYDYKMNKLIKV